MSQEEKLEGRWEEVVSNSLGKEGMGREGKESFAAPLSFLLITFPPTGGERFLAERKGVQEEMVRL